MDSRDNLREGTYPPEGLDISAIQHVQSEEDIYGHGEEMDSFLVNELDNLDISRILNGSNDADVSALLAQLGNRQDQDLVTGMTSLQMDEALMLLKGVGLPEMDPSGLSTDSALSTAGLQPVMVGSFYSTAGSALPLVGEATLRTLYEARGYQIKELESRLTQLEDSTNAEIARLMQNLVSVEDRGVDLTTQLEQWQERCKIAEQQLGVQKASLDQLADTNENLSSELYTTQARVAMLSQQLAEQRIPSAASPSNYVQQYELSVASLRSRHEQELYRKDKEFEEISTRLAWREEECSRLRNEVAELSILRRNTFSLKDGATSPLPFHEAYADMDTCSVRAHAELQKNAGRLEEELINCKSELLELQARFIDISHQKDHLLQNIQQMKEDLAKDKQHLIEEHRLAQAAAVAEAKRSAQVELERKHHEKINSLSRLVEELQRALDESRREYTDLSRELRDVQQRHQSVTVHSPSSRDELTKLRAELTAKESELESLRSVHSSQESMFKMEISTLKTQLGAIRTVRSDADASGIHLPTLLKQMTELTSSRAALETENFELQLQHSQDTDKLSHVTSELRQREAVLSRAELSLQRYREQCDQLGSQVEELGGTVALLTEDLARTQKEQQLRYMEDTQKLRAEIGILKSSSDLMESKLVDQVAALADVQSQLRDRTHQLSKVTDLCTELQEQLTFCFKERDELIAFKQDSGQQLKSLAGENGKLRALVQSLQAQLTSAKELGSVGATGTHDKKPSPASTLTSSSWLNPKGNCVQESQKLIDQADSIFKLSRDRFTPAANSTHSPSSKKPSQEGSLCVNIDLDPAPLGSQLPDPLSSQGFETGTPPVVRTGPPEQPPRTGLSGSDCRLSSKLPGPLDDQLPSSPRNLLRTSSPLPLLTSPDRTTGAGDASAPTLVVTNCLRCAALQETFSKRLANNKTYCAKLVRKTLELAHQEWKRKNSEKVQRAYNLGLQRAIHSGGGGSSLSSRSSSSTDMFGGLAGQLCQEIEGLNVSLLDASPEPFHPIPTVHKGVQAGGSETALPAESSCFRTSLQSCLSMSVDSLHHQLVDLITSMHHTYSDLLIGRLHPQRSQPRFSLLSQEGTPAVSPL